MKYTLKRLDQICGDKASFYTVLIEDNDGKYTKFQEFIKKIEKKFEAQLPELFARIKRMSMELGAVETFFKPESSNQKIENVFACWDEPDKKLRLYSIRMSETLVVLGSGGHKPWYCKKWQDSRELSKEVEFIMIISELIAGKIKSGKLGVSNDGRSFTGNLIIFETKEKNEKEIEKN